MGAQAPQWLASSFVDALTEVGATATSAEASAEAQELIRMWNAPGRTAHNIRHLIHVLALIDELSSTTHDPEIVRLAAWYHGATMSRNFNDCLSTINHSAALPSCAKVTRKRLDALGTPDAVTGRVIELLSCLAQHDAPPHDSDAQVLVDADLGRLASSPQEFTKYRQCLREEYAGIDDLTYYQARRRAVRDLLNRDSIFFTDHGSDWEDVARSNLELELARIEDRLRELAPSAPLDSPEDSVPSATHSPPVIVSAPKSDEDLISEKSIQPAHATIIKRRSIRPVPTQEHEDLSTTGVLPRITVPSIEETRLSNAHSVSDDSDVSSLETAIDALEIP